MSLNLELHSKEFLFYPILQNIDEGILITDTSLQVIFFNEHAEKSTTSMQKILLVSMLIPSNPALI